MQRLLLGGCLVAAVGCATVPIPPDAKEIDTFDIEGEKQLSESDIKEKIVTTVSPWLPTWLPGVEPQWFDPIIYQCAAFPFACCSTFSNNPSGLRCSLVKH